jgi:hypothetical protein
MVRGEVVNPETNLRHGGEETMMEGWAKSRRLTGRVLAERVSQHHPQ